ncbi:alpha/beta hydrolase family protein [Shewanella woodyi]|uniref:Peptidase S9 prolyl oligopeptidase active site domain protein n=1 Tax=Shewanella woodyi (strain ATCC 51908 / MS32) TaxID=392500 RepID=B1KIM1_SHEWM|nr:prolyl oligopeptidase family serine peptidase [Shewanella woodyi]ACA88517.1 peptidase S9 prolyl oligopeptidase active site domain protein [Shewanella woodyi ATCC 51908]
MKKYLTTLVLVFISFYTFSNELVTISEESHIKKTEKIANSFFKAYQVNSVKLSPDGNFILLMQDTGTLSQLVLLNTETFKKSLIIEDKFDDQISIEDFYWIDNSSIVLEAYIEGKGRGLLLSKLIIDKLELKGVENKYLLDDVFLSNPLPDVKNKFIVGKWDEGKTSLYRLDISREGLKGQLRSKFKLNKRGPEATHWLTNSNGIVTVGYGVDENKSKKRVWVKDLKSRKWDLIWEGEEKFTFQPVLVSKDNKTLYILSNEQDDFISLYEYDIVDKTYKEKVYDNVGFDIHSAIVSIDRENILGVSFIEDGFLKHIYFSEIDKVLDGALKLAIDESKPYVIDFNLKKTIAIVETSSSIDPGTYHLFRIDSLELIKFSSKAPWLKQYDLGSSQVIISKSTDGQSIESYLTLPASKTTNPPLIVLPHGGPISVRDTRHFNTHVQFLASLGYAVLQPNYRGSSGYGKEFKNEGMQQWGRLIENDIQSGINEVINQGLVDPSKVCIYGISYGGYSALISAINRPDIFKCAASYAGVTDLTLLFNNVNLSESERSNNLLSKIVGDPETELDILMKYSPVYEAKKITVPIFLAQGDKDTIVDIEHYYRMKIIMDIYGVKYDSVLLEGEAHGFKYLKSIVLFYTKLDLFFRKSLNLEEI